jgi:regulator of nucleoside diphosphate kinase
MTTISFADFELSPQIVLGAAEHRELTALARTADASEWQRRELARARIVPDAAVPSDVVRMNATVLFRLIGGEEQSAQLVHPESADAAAGRISVLTPVGSALIGLRAGQSITWPAPDGRKQLLTVLSIAHAAGANGHDDDDDPGPFAA